MAAPYRPIRTWHVRHRAHIDRGKLSSLPLSLSFSLHQTWHKWFIKAAEIWWGSVGISLSAFMGSLHSHWKKCLKSKIWSANHYWCFLIPIGLTLFNWLRKKNQSFLVILDINSHDLHPPFKISSNYKACVRFMNFIERVCLHLHIIFPHFQITRTIFQGSRLLFYTGSCSLFFLIFL